MAVELKRSQLEQVFGDVSSGSNPDDFARHSAREFVRSQDHLALASEQATGRRLTAWEAYKAFGINKLKEVFDHGSAILASDPLEPASTIRKCREARGLEISDVARAAGVTPSEVAEAENPKQTNSIQLLEKIAKILGFEESRLGIRSTSDADESLAFRLRQMKNSPVGFTPNAVLAFDEAAWVIQKQTILSEWIYGKWDFRALGFETDSRFGNKQYPAWQYGYDLARDTRKYLGLKPGAPIESLRNLVESVLKIPLVHLPLPAQFAGATIAVGATRGIAVNINGLNKNEWVRRATIAHELGHLLWDPDQNLKSLVVDSFVDLEEPPQLKLDPVEARANAFAIELLAPQEYAVDIFKSSDQPRQGLRNVMTYFGVSFTSAKFQVWNALNRSIPLEAFAVDDVEPTDDWKGRESFTVDYFKPKTVPISRRGQFARYVVDAMNRKLISKDSAASFLECSEEEVVASAEEIMNLYDVPQHQ